MFPRLRARSEEFGTRMQQEVFWTHFPCEDVGEPGNVKGRETQLRQSYREHKERKHAAAMRLARRPGGHGVF